MTYLVICVILVQYCVAFTGIEIIIGTIILHNFGWASRCSYVRPTLQAVLSTKMVALSLVSKPNTKNLQDGSIPALKGMWMESQWTKVAQYVRTAISQRLCKVAIQQIFICRFEML